MRASEGYGQFLCSQKMAKSAVHRAVLQDRFGDVVEWFGQEGARGTVYRVFINNRHRRTKNFSYTLNGIIIQFSQYTSGFRAQYVPGNDTRPGRVRKNPESFAFGNFAYREGFAHTDHF